MENKISFHTENREITCGCGVILYPFEAMLNLANYCDRIIAQHDDQNEERKQWLKEKTYSVISQ